MRRFELTLARRLGWKPEGRKRVSPAVGVAVTGVALSIVVMLLSVAVMLGFKREVSTRLFGLDDAVTVTGYDPNERPKDFAQREVLDIIKLPAGAKVNGEVQLFGILKTADDFLGVNFTGSDARAIADSLVWLSRSAAQSLRVERGDAIPAYFFKDGRLRVRKLTVDSIYSTGFEEHDKVTAYCSPAMVRKLAGMPAGNVNSLGITNVVPEAIDTLTSAIHGSLLQAFYDGRLTTAYGITNIYQVDQSFFSWLSLLDTNVVVILGLMGAVAAFTLISSLFIIILERVRTIGLLKALGSDNGQIRRIFMLMAERLVLRGLLWGNIIGLGLTAVQYFTHVVPLDPEAYYVNFVPVAFNWPAIIGINVGALALSWLVLMLPAMIVARISPSTTMRYE